MNNLNKLALVALSLFLAVGVNSCSGCDRDSKAKEKPTVELTINKDKLSKNFDTNNKKLNINECTFRITVKVTEGEISEEDLGNFKLSGDCAQKDKTLKDLKITKSLKKGESASFDIQCFFDEADLQALNAKVSISGTADTEAAKAERKRINDMPKKEFGLEGDVTVAKKAELAADFKPIP